jgi:uncharacterized protein DUF6932
VLPPFDEHGNLPAGIHRCTIEELAARFGSGSEERLTELSELLGFIAAAQRAGVRRLLVNGSFVTSKSAPNDVDVVILPGPSPQTSDESYCQAYVILVNLRKRLS